MTFIGTIHVDPSSAVLVRETLERLRPEVVALELDEARARALLNPKKPRASLSMGSSFLAIALLERFAGQLTGSPPGAEMLQAYEVARSLGSRVELIDLPIGVTVSGLRKLPLNEKARIAIDSFASLFLLPLGRVDFSELAEGVDTQIPLFKKRYPSLGKLLLEDRERYMVNRLLGILQATTGHVVAVVGLGHLAALRTALEASAYKPTYSTTVSWSFNTGAGMSAE